MKNKQKINKNINCIEIIQRIDTQYQFTTEFMIVIVIIIKKNCIYYEIICNTIYFFHCTTHTIDFI